MPEELSALEKVNALLLQGKPARMADLTKEERESIKSLMLLTLKPVIYAANVADTDLATGNDMSKKVFDFAAAEGNKAVLVSAQVREKKHEEERVVSLIDTFVIILVRWSLSWRGLKRRIAGSSSKRWE